MTKFASFLIANLELILAGMSIPVIALIHIFVSPHFENPWEITAAAALAVGVLHGILGWTVRARQRSVRVALLQRIWATLQKEQAVDSGRAAQPAGSHIPFVLAQLPALLREPVIVRTMPLPAPTDPARQGIRQGVQV